MRPISVVFWLCLVLVLPACGGGSSPTSAPTPALTPTPAPAPTPMPTPAAPLVTGFWDSEARRWHIRLEQQGTNLTGSLLGYKDVYYSNPEDADLKITGTISGTQVDFKANAFGLNFGGVVQPGGTRIDGTLRDCANGCRNYGEQLVKQ